MKQLDFVRETVNHLFWALLLQGLVFVLLAIAILLYPALLVALFVATFLVIGLVLIALAIKLRTIWNKAPEILK